MSSRPARLFVFSRPLAVVLACLAALAFRSGAHAQATATAESPSPGRGVEILWDNYGVGHVYAADVEGLFFGYGYVQLASHGDLVLRLYGESRGRAAEYWGVQPGASPHAAATFLDSDRWVHTNNVPARSAAWFAEQTPEFRRYLEAFAAGMNAYAARHPAAFTPELRRVLPITGVDPLQHVHRIVHFTYLSPLARVAAAAKGTGARSVGEGEDPFAPPSREVSASSVLTLASSLALDSQRSALDPSSAVPPHEDAIGGSNAWAIAPARTAAGHSLLLMNPHLPWGDWSTYYEAHLSVPSLGINLSGASQIGFPVLRFVFSDTHGFTQTVNNLDGSDLYRVDAAEVGYRFDGIPRRYATRRVQLQVRQPDGSLQSESLEIRETVHGPVVWDRDGLVLAQRTVGLDRPHLLEQYWQMAIAKNFDAYQAQLRRLQVPTFNITYADRDGHVMYLYNGLVPRRRTGDRAFWAGVVPGDTSATLWHAAGDLHPYADLPKVIDPPTGFVQNTNDPPWSATHPGVLDPAAAPAYFPGTDYTFRTMRSLELLTQEQQWTLEKLVAAKHSTRLALADRILDDLLVAAAAHGTERARRAAAVLAAWDRHAEATSRGTVLFQEWAENFMGSALTGRSGFAVAQDGAAPFTTPRGLADPVAAARQLDEAAAEVEAEHGALDVAWGDVMRLRLADTDLPGNGATGGLGAFRVVRFAAAKPGDKQRRAVFGDTFVAAVEFAPEGARAQVLTSYGTASRPGTAHFADQLPLLAEKKLRPALRTRAEVEAETIRRETF